MAKRVTKEQEQGIVALYGRLKSGTQVAKQLGMSTTTVHNVLVRNGVELVGLKLFRESIQKLPDYETLKKEYEGGMNMTQVAAKYGVSVSTVHEAMQKAGVTSKSAGRPSVPLAAWQIEKIKELHHQGITQQRIAKAVGTYQSRVSEVLVESGLVVLAEQHGMSRTPEYRTWVGMIQRCTNENGPNYRHYGGRGITVCEKWTNSFMAFLEDMGKRPSPEMSLDRINNDLGYSKENCKWATKLEQSRNTRVNSLISHEGQTLCVSEWASLTGIPLCTIVARMGRGWTPKETLTTPTLRLHRDTEAITSQSAEPHEPESELPNC